MDKESWEDESGKGNIRCKKRGKTWKADGEEKKWKTILTEIK